MCQQQQHTQISCLWVQSLMSLWWNAPSRRISHLHQSCCHLMSSNTFSKVRAGTQNPWWEWKAHLHNQCLRFLIFFWSQKFPRISKLRSLLKISTNSEFQTFKLKVSLDKIVKDLLRCCKTWNQSMSQMSNNEESQTENVENFLCFYKPEN